MSWLQPKAMALCSIPDSFQEKEIVELCIGWSQAHPEGVLQLRILKQSLHSWSSSEMMAVICLFTAAMVWHDEPIKICVHPPMGAQVREYVVLRGRHPSSAQAQMQGGEVVSQSSPSEPWGPQQYFALALRDLDDAQVRQVMEELQQETAKRDGITLRLGSPFSLWHGPAAGVDADLDDRKMTF